MSEYSYSGNTYTDKSDGDVIEPEHINNLQDEVEVVEGVITGGTDGQVLTADAQGKAGWENSRLYKVCIRNVSQPGTNDPIGTIFENTIINPITVTRGDVGIYTLSCDDFNGNDTIVISPGVAFKEFPSAIKKYSLIGITIITGYIIIYCNKTDFTGLQDGLYQYPVEIRIYD